MFACVFVTYSENSWVIKWPIVIFINILQAAFALTDPQKHKKYNQVVSLFWALGYAGVKAVCKILLKLISSLTTKM